MARCLCNLYEKSLADGDATLTGAFIGAFKRLLPYDLILTNISMVCHRKGEDGVELEGGQAGCVDPTGDRLEALALVKELHYLCLQAAGLEVIATIASSNASIQSFFGNHSPGAHFEGHEGTGTYEGRLIFTAPHPKYVSPNCVFSASVAKKLGVPLGDRLAVTSACVEGWAVIATSIASLQRCEDETFDDFEEGVQHAYKALLDDTRSKAVAREWEHRHTSKTTPATQARLEKALAEQG